MSAASSVFESASCAALGLGLGLGLGLTLTLTLTPNLTLTLTPHLTLTLTLTRLGNLRGEADDIKSHHWFISPSRPSILSSSFGVTHPSLVPFDWDQLAQGTMPPPCARPQRERLGPGLGL